MAEPIVVAPCVVIPGSAIVVKATRSSGPGGQNVNKVASKIELRVDLSRVEGLDEGARARLAGAVRSRLDAEGRLVLTSQRTRDQHRNLEDAREKARAIVARAIEVPRTRKPTRASAGARARRLEEKKRKSRLKRTRAGRGLDTD
jgi:ribosome-associated protein